MIRILCLSLLFFTAELNAKALKHPIILVHGASMGGAVLKVGPLNLGPYFLDLPAYLESLGARVAVPNLSTDSSIGERAIILKHFIQRKFPQQKVNIVGHSLGGLDARYLVSVLKSDQVASITTIATPHLGSPLADWAYRQAQTNGFWYRTLKFFGYDLKGRRFLPELTTDYMKNVFNPKVKDREDVQYFSIKTWAKFFRGSLSPILLPTAYFIEQEAHPMSQEKNDGLVPMSSQAWGTILEETEIDHLGQMNHHSFRLSQKEKSLALYKRIYQNLLDRQL